MKNRQKEDIIEEIETEACGFGSLRLAMKAFREMTGADTVRKLRDLRSYLASLSDDALSALSERFRDQLDLNAYPKLI